MTASRPNVRLEMWNRAENVLVVREMLSGVAETIVLEEADVNDIRTAVTEAANNVVVHAYAGAEGRLEVEVFVLEEALEVLVRDHGSGMPSSDSEEEDLANRGIGLSVMDALSESASFAIPPGGGTEVRMRFATPGARKLAARGGDEETNAGMGPAVLEEPPEKLAVSIAPQALARNILPRLLGVVAAQANFSTDRISDTQLVADALVAQAARSMVGGRIGLTVSSRPREVELRVGPLLSGAAAGLVAGSNLEGLGTVLEKLSDRHTVASTDEQELLTLQLLDAPG